MSTERCCCEYERESLDLKKCKNIQKQQQHCVGVRFKNVLLLGLRELGDGGLGGGGMIHRLVKLYTTYCHSVYSTWDLQTSFLPFLFTLFCSDFCPYLLFSIVEYNSHLHLESKSDISVLVHLGKYYHNVVLSYHNY